MCRAGSETPLLVRQRISLPLSAITDRGYTCSTKRQPFLFLLKINSYHVFMKQRKHLRRLGIVFQSHPRYLITVCTHLRKPFLTCPDIHDILRQNWGKSLELHGWAIGSYVVMPDHVHFFCADAEGKVPLSRMVGSWKQWSAKRIGPLLGIDAPLWQREFFDHLIRSGESYSEKWEYVRQNPVRAGLVPDADEWQFMGHINYI